MGLTGHTLFLRLFQVRNDGMILLLRQFRILTQFSCIAMKTWMFYSIYFNHFLFNAKFDLRHIESHAFSFRKFRYGHQFIICRQSRPISHIIRP